ncbi:hypothetical protein CR513_21189, partial [Mucuna pruriens]
MAWSVELSEFTLKFEPRGTLKIRALTNILVEMTSSPKVDPWWTLYVDDSSNPKGGGVVIILEGLVGVTFEYSLKFDFKASNNQAKYEALVIGLDLAQEVGARRVCCHTNSQLVVEHIKETYQRFDGSEVQHVPHTNNSHANTLVRMATTKIPHRRTILHRVLPSLVVDKPEILHAKTEDREWMTPIWNYLQQDTYTKEGSPTPS